MHFIICATVHVQYLFRTGLFSLTWSLFQQFPFLNKTGENTDEVFENWKKYKYSVPVYGAIMLNQMLDKVTIIILFIN